MSGHQEIVTHQEFSDNQFTFQLFEKKVGLRKELEKKFHVVIDRQDGDVVITAGNPANAAKAAQALIQLSKIYAEDNYALTKENVRRIAHEFNAINKAEPAAFGKEKKPYVFSPRNENQSLLANAIKKNDLTFAIGAAGTGKTHVAAALGYQALKDRKVEKLVLVRPVVATEDIGFLPGSAKEKLDPYMQPLYDELEKIVGSVEVLEGLIKRGIIQIAPLAFMRGRTFENAFIIVDEAQNAHIEQTRMYMTRVGTGSYLVVCGDPTQNDLERINIPSGLPWAVRRLTAEKIAGVDIVTFSNADINRSELVKKILPALDMTDDELAALEQKKAQKENSLSQTATAGFSAPVANKGQSNDNTLTAGGLTADQIQTLEKATKAVHGDAAELKNVIKKANTRANKR